MRKATETVTVPEFPANYGWVSHKFYTVRPSTGRAMEVLARHFLRNDNDFRHLLRQCKKKWIVALTLGMDTVTIQVYSPAQIDDPLRRPMSPQLINSATVVLETDRFGEFTMVSAERREVVSCARPFLAAERALKPSEIEAFRHLETAVNEELFDSPRTVDPEGDQRMLSQFPIPEETPTGTTPGAKAIIGSINEHFEKK